MNDAINQLTYSLFKKNTPDDCTVDEIRSLADKYPYFSPLQFLLSKKMMTEKHKDYKRQAAKASLYFKNPVFFNHILNNHATSSIVKETAERKEISESPPPVPEKKFEEHTNDEWVIENKKADIPENGEQQSRQMQEDENLKIRALLEKEASQSEQEMKLVFGPFHTVDYFASQGIEVKEDEKPADRFSVQLKSFTEWLKELKKAPAAAIAEKHETRDEEKIISMAEHSLDDKEIVTESMAEVWVKQGDKEKAIETYSKLSLLNPSKSAYFASLIEKLKA